MSHWPVEIRLRRAERALEIDWDDGRKDVIPAELLRVESPSAEVQGHGPATKKLVAGKKNVTVTGAEPIGNYAVRLIFDDGHDSGLFTWETLRRFGETKAEMFTAYLEALHGAGLSR